MKQTDKKKPNAENSVTKQRVIGRPFPKGVSGNPAGKPKGLKSFSTDMDEVIKDYAKENKVTFNEARKILLKKAFDEAKKGKFPFYKDIIDRYYGKTPEKIEMSGELAINQVLNSLDEK